ncbi:MAG: hypothetical protein RI993_1730 [Pseudomonadota bacterium]|nr:hypothetical protein [Nitrosomonas sp.]
MAAQLGESFHLLFQLRQPVSHPQVTLRYAQRPIRDLNLLARYGIHLITVHRKDASIGEGSSPWWMLLIVIMLTSILTEMLSNNARRC